MPELFSASATSRRRLLAWGGLAVLGAQTGCRARDAGSAPRAVPPAQLDAFMAASRRVTGHARLDPELGRRLYAALSAAYPALDAKLDGLGRSGAPQAGAAGPQTTAGLERRLLRAWYLGLVGDGFAARAYAYEAALMYPPVADKVVMQSYCHGAPGYWAQPA